MDKRPSPHRYGIWMAERVFSPLCLFVVQKIEIHDFKCIIPCGRIQPGSRGRRMRSVCHGALDEGPRDPAGPILCPVDVEFLLRRPAEIALSNRAAERSHPSGAVGMSITRHHATGPGTRISSPGYHRGRCGIRRWSLSPDRESRYEPGDPARAKAGIPPRRCRKP